MHGRVLLLHVLGEGADECHDTHVRIVTLLPDRLAANLFEEPKREDYSASANATSPSLPK